MLLLVKDGLLLLFGNWSESEHTLSDRGRLGDTRKYLLVACFAVNLLDYSAPASAQLVSELEQNQASDGRSFSPEDFARFAPRNALDMLNRVPGFAVQNDDQGRGFGQANTNVLVNGQRLSSKSQSVFDQLRRVTASNVDRIVIVDGASLDIPGLSGQVADVITHSSDITGSYEYRTVHRPKYAEPGWFGGEVSVSGASSRLEWNAAYNHGLGRGAGNGGSIISDQFGEITERRDVHSHFEGDFPSLSGSLKWFGPADTITNLNLEYSKEYTDFSNDEDRDLVTGIDQFRDFDNRGRGSSYEIGADTEFGLGPGTLKLIGLESREEHDFSSMSRLLFEDGSDTTGDRFARQRESGERIGRAEYQWDMLGGNWQVALESAFNHLDQSSQLFVLEPDGNFDQVSLPNSVGEVTEDRYEMIITHGRTFENGFNLQLGIGGEKSTLSQTGPSGLTRNFWRPKGSMTLSWSPNEDMDLSLNIERKVDQLSFGQFLANVDLQLQNANAGNAELKPTLSWETTLQVKQNFGEWGSTTFELFANHYDDYIDIIPLPGGGESQGNITKAELYGIDWTGTINFDPLGWEGARLDATIQLEKSNIKDPLTGVDRYFSRHFDRDVELSLRHDVSGTDWAWGAGLEYNHVQPSYRLSQVSLSYEGPTYTFAFLEYKDIFGMTASLNVFNLTDGRSIFERTVYSGLRDSSDVLFHESQDLDVQPIFRFELSGNF